jgi:hypothetical protein
MEKYLNMDRSPGIQGLMRLPMLCLALVVLAVASGCTSADPKYTQKRTAQLLEVYPLGTTTRADVQKRLLGKKPEISEIRPADGWENCHYRHFGERCLKSERRTGTPVYRCDRYLEPDGWYAYSYNWFFYDSADRLIDVEWQYASNYGD